MRVRGEKGARVLVLSGEPIDEPVVPLRTLRDEHARRDAMEAMRDYQSGKMGHL